MDNQFTFCLEDFAIGNGSLIHEPITVEVTVNMVFEHQPTRHGYILAGPFVEDPVFKVSMGIGSKAADDDYADYLQCKLIDPKFCKYIDEAALEAWREDAIDRAADRDALLAVRGGR
jgi:uncharacterized protein (DUF736 family)